MKFKPEITFLMSALKDAIAPDGQKGLQSILDQIGLEGVLDVELFKAARFFDQRPLLIFLATLGVENTNERAHYQRWLSSAQFLDGQITLDEAARSCACGRGMMVDFYRDLLGAVSSKSSEGDSQCDWLGLPCQAPDLLFATEFLLDNLSVQYLPKVLKRWRQLDTSGEPWLWICRSVAERVEYAKKLQKTDALAKTFEFLFAEMSTEHQSLVNSFMPYLVNLQLKSERSDDAMATAQSYALRAPGMSSDYWLMMCHARRSEFSLAVNCAAAVLGDSVSLALSEMKDSAEAVKSESRKKSTFDVELAGESLKLVNRILRARGLQPFLMSGVLLGYHREGALLAHDKDVDIGLIGWEQQFVVAQALQAAGNFHISWRDVKGESTYLFDAYDLKNNVTLDFFFFHPHKDHFLHGIDYKYGFTQNLKFSHFSLTEVDFLEEKFFIPDNVAQNLTENYGDWQTPQPSYVVTVESPALVDKGSLKHQFISIVELMRCVSKFKSVTRMQRILGYWDSLGIPLVSIEMRRRLDDWMLGQAPN